MNTARLRDRIEALEKEKLDLKAKVDELEKITAAQQIMWKQAETNSKQQDRTLQQVGVANREKLLTAVWIIGSVNLVITPLC